MRYFAVLMVMVMMVFGGSTVADEKDDEVYATRYVGYSLVYDYNRYPHFFYHHKDDEYKVDGDWAHDYMEHLFYITDKRIDALDGLAKSVYLILCSSPGRNEANCSKLGSAIREIITLEDEHYEAFCSTDLTERGKDIIHDYNLPLDRVQSLPNLSYAICIRLHGKGHDKEFYTKVGDDFEAFLKSGRVEQISAQPRRYEGLFGKLTDGFFSFRSEFRQPEPTSPTQ